MKFSYKYRAQFIALLYITAGIALLIASGMLMPLVMFGFGSYCIYKGLQSGALFRNRYWY